MNDSQPQDMWEDIDPADAIRPASIPQSPPTPARILDSQPVTRNGGSGLAAKILPVVLMVVLLGGGGWWLSQNWSQLFGNNSPTEDQTPMDEPMVSQINWQGATESSKITPIKSW